MMAGRMKPLWVPLLVFAIALALIRLTGADFALCDWSFDRASMGFPWRFSPGADQLHRGSRDVVIGLGIVAAALALVGDRTGKPPTREVARMVTLSLILSTSLIAVMKTAINRSCPWSYTRYGGTVVEGSEQPMLQLGNHEAAFPAGHAAGGYSFMVLYFAGRRRSAPAAAAGLAFGLVFGTFLGVSQVVRGAHFLSHNVWTALICWYVAWGVDRLVPRPG